MDILADNEKSLIALSLFGFVMRSGPSTFKKTLAIAEKIGVSHELEAYAKDWLAEPKSAPSQSQTVHELQGTPEAIVKKAIFDRIVWAWAGSEGPVFIRLATENVYHELFEKTVSWQPMAEVNQTYFDINQPDE